MPDTVPHPAPPLLPPDSRYQILRFHAAGGLGRVYVGLDRELGRQVAVKFIRPEWAGADTAVGRFRREAEVTGRLEHPGVVPVYGLLELADGTVCYAMRFLQGRTLAEAVARLHAAETPAADRPRELRTLLGHFVAVCNAVGFAHSRGVLHRDLKPANVMLGDFGETWVLDWGLAKWLADPAVSAAPATAPASPDSTAVVGPTGTVVAPAAGPTGTVAAPDRPTPTPVETRAGEVMGTPAYMAPEQARGEPVGVPADVWALGAILYEICTGRPPYTGDTIGERLTAAAAGVFPRPRAVSPAVPPPLEAICLRATAVPPTDRYPDALNLAADVERWLADESVSAYRDPARERVRRWAKRNRTLVATLAAAAAVGLVASAAGLAVTTGLNRRLDQANAALGTTNDDLAAANAGLTDANAKLTAARADADARRAEAERERADAARSAAEARAAVERYFVTVSEDQLLTEPGMLPLRRKLLGAALDFYKGLAADQRQRPGDRDELAKTLERIAAIQMWLGAWDDAIASITAAREIAAPAGSGPPDPARARRLANIDYYLAVALNGANRPAEAAEAVKRAQSWAPAAGDEAQQRAEAAVVNGMMANLTGKPDAALKLLREGTASLDALVRESPRNPKYRYLLAGGQWGLGTQLAQLDNRAEAEEVFQRALTHARLLILDHPANRDYRHLEKKCLASLGELLRKAGRYAEAVKYLTEAADYHEAAAVREPNNAVVREAAANAWYQLGLAQIDGGQRPAGLKSVHRGFAHYADILRREPQNQMIANRAFGHCTELVRGERFAEAQAALGTLIDLLTPHLGATARLRQLVQPALIARAYSHYYAGEFDRGAADAARAAEVAGQETPLLVALRQVGVASLGRHAEAAAALDRLPPVAPGGSLTPLELRTRAWGYAAAAAAVRDDARVPAGERAEAQKRYAAKGVELLRQSTRNRPPGDNAKLLRKQSAIAALAADPAVRRMLDALAEPPPPREAAPAPRPVR